MGLYNIVFGQNPLSEVILATLGLDKSTVGRFRDCFISSGEIAVYTRLGGGNRECWCEEGEKHYCSQESIRQLQTHPNYLRDADDTYDNTYATFYFSFPTTSRPLLVALEQDWAFEPDRRWLDKLAEVEGLSKEELEQKYPALVRLVSQVIETAEKK